MTDELESTGDPLKILTLDLETAPHLAHVWKLWDENVSLKQLIEPTTVICFASKWVGSNRVEFFSDFHDGHEAMVQAAWERLDQADVVVTYNGRAFDNKHLRREILLAGLTPPSPWLDVDLLAVVRKQFRFASNKLEHVAQQLGLGGKAETGGFELWRDCLAGDERAWNRMRKYNMRDVRLTEKVYLSVLPWIGSHPNIGLWTGQERACPNCGSENVQKRGFDRTRSGTYQRFHCQDCGSWSRGVKRLSTTELR